jgi:hypothetical protein
VWDSANGLLFDDDKACLDRLLRPLDQPKFSFAELENTWQKKNDPPYALLCFYCHASGNQLCIGEETRSHSVFAPTFSRSGSHRRPPTLVFLAGCETAVADLDSGYLGATSGPGYCGFIGTEVKVPDVFTLGFLACFLDRFYRGGHSVAEVLHRLRAEHWPLSLVFSMCCARDLRVAPHPAPARDERERQNLCEWQIASA